MAARSPQDEQQVAVVRHLIKVAGQRGVTLDPGFVAAVASGMQFGQTGVSPQGLPQPPGVYNRLKEAISYLVAGVTPATWFGPWQSITPQAQAPEQGVIGRQFDYPVGVNLNITPRSYDDISFPMLRAFGDNYDLLRLAIETCKDQIESFEWEIIPIDPKADESSFKDEIKRVTEFWEYPDREHNWAQWLRMVVEDMLVIDAVAVFPTQTRGGGLYSLDVMDGGTIARVIDQYGRTPMPPSPAYRQVLKGIPAVEYTRDDLMYVVRNPRSNRLYGYSPVTQVITTVNIAMRRQMMQLEEYTSGSIPDALISLPDSWTSDQIKDFQDWFDTILSGQTAERRKARFIPETKSVTMTKQPTMKDDYDEWLARIICWSLSISPTALVKTMNRASSEQTAETAKEEGQLPRMRFISGMVNDINKRWLKAEGVQFAWKMARAMNPLDQAKVDQIYVQEKVKTPDELREGLGLDPLTPEEKEAAWPSPPPPPLPGNALKPGEEASQSNQPTKGGDSTQAGNAPGTQAPPAVKVDVHLPPQAAPVINLGDTFVRVAPPDVNVGGVTTIHGGGEYDPAVRKIFKGRRNKETGDLEAEMLLVPDTAYLAKQEKV